MESSSAGFVRRVPVGGDSCEPLDAGHSCRRWAHAAARSPNVESLFHRGELEVAQQAIKPAEHAVQPTVVTESRNERNRQAGLVGIYFPRMHVEHCRDTSCAVLAESAMNKGIG